MNTLPLPALVAQALCFLSESSREYMLVVSLNSYGKLLSAEVVPLEPGNTARLAFRSALVAGAQSISVARCIDVMRPTPEASDLEFAKRLLVIGRSVNIKVLDLVLVGSSEHVSIRSFAPDLGWERLA